MMLWICTERQYLVDRILTNPRKAPGITSNCLDEAQIIKYEEIIFVLDRIYLNLKTFFRNTIDRRYPHVERKSP